MLRATAQRGLARAGQPVDQCEDIVQEVLLAVHLKRHTWDPTAPVGPWLFAIARNKIIDALRRRGRRVFVDIDDFIDVLPGEEQPGVMSGLRFPMTSRLEPGIFEGRSRQALDPRWLTQPIFVIAAEPDSLVWLQRNRAALHAMSATGVVVSAVNEEAFKIIQREAKGLPVAPALDPWLQDRLMAAGVNVVPVLIQIDGHASQELK